jgi:hypothetical protein
MATAREDPAPGAERLPRVELVKILGASLGQEKAADAIHHACVRLALKGDAFTMDETMRILETLATTPGLVGTVARFAKARVILKFGEM